MEQSEGHIAKGYDGALSSLRLRVVEMGGLVSDQVTAAVRALLESDAAAAEQVLAREKQINAYDSQIESESFGLLARRAPVASDLRLILGVRRAIRDLERAGDEAKKIARLALTARQDRSDPSPAVHTHLHDMAQRASDMMRSAVDALDRSDATVARVIARLDKELDREFEAAMRQLMTVATQDRSLLPPIIDTVFALKSLERIGDHAKNVAESVVFIATGIDVRHAKSQATAEGAPDAGVRS